MNLWQRIFSGSSKPDAAQPRAMAGDVFHGLDDPRLLEYIRQGGSSGGTSVADALKNTAVLRSVDLISGVIGRLPLNIKETQANGAVIEATDHSLHSVLMHKPNAWQNANQFKSLMQTWALVHGNAVAQIVTVQGRVLAFNPLHPTRVSIEQRPDFSLEYQVTGRNNLTMRLEAAQVLHIRGPSEDGIKGWSPVRQAADVIQAHVNSQRAANKIYQNGMMAGGVFKMPAGRQLSQAAYDRLKASIEATYSGVDNAGKWPILEEGLEADPFPSTAKDAQMVEFRAALVEDIARVFGVPRPLLGVNETSWGSGIEQLAILFIRFGLAPWFDAWEQEIKIKCLRPSEWGRFTPDFEERELLRGTIKEQFEAYAKAAGSGGHMPWMETNEIRRDLGLGDHADGQGLKPAGMTNEQAEPVQTAGV